MAREVYALTDIKGSDVFVEAGQKLTTAQFTREELKNLMDAGAIEVREVTEKVEEPKGPDTMVTKPGNEEENVEDEK